MNALSQVLHQTARSIRVRTPTIGVTWYPVADALDRYAEGWQKYSDFLAVRAHREVILSHVHTGADRPTMEAWLDNLREPEPNPNRPSAER
jgi:hypothetical protein